MFIAYLLSGMMTILSFTVYASSMLELKGNLLTSFGTGDISVRMYADYFCAPCRASEPKIDVVIKELVRKNIINITFIDAPFHKSSSLYARYFLYILNNKKDFKEALLARSVLFDGAHAGITAADKLEEYLRKNGLKFKQFYVEPVFKEFVGFLKDDKIDSTPTCVIIIKGRKEIFRGGEKIINALKGLEKN